ncbi:MAG: LysM peptidoglycan-binding domain-containing protein, partial [Proteiniphilum sp.]|nr:LysM peptidoglycan-binding domain-containing protein [Proteiniphilum sp.]
NVYYRVKKGDNLSTIARKNGISLSQLKSWNGLKSSRIGIGKQLIVGQREAMEPEKNAQINANTVSQYYRVKKGDTLGKIAQENGVNVSQLQSWNGLQSTRIGVGDQLIVEMKEAAEPAVPQTEKTVEYSRAETSEEGSSIISSYLKDQIEKTGENHSSEEIDDRIGKE